MIGHCWLPAFPLVHPMPTVPNYPCIALQCLFLVMVQGSCSMYGAWGNATASTGKTFQLRALDWDIDGPFKNYAAVIVYHPSGTSNGHAFANVGFIGWIGALSGQSSAQMAISEIGLLVLSCLGSLPLDDCTLVQVSAIRTPHSVKKAASACRLRSCCVTSCRCVRWHARLFACAIITPLAVAVAV